MRSRGLFLVFSVAVLLPGIALTVLGTRALMHDRLLAEYDAHERLGRAADAVLRELEAEFREWRWALERVSSGGRGASTLPTSLRPAIAAAGALLVLQVDDQGVHWWPQDGLLYSFPKADDESNDTLMSRSPASQRARLLHGRGRARRDAGESSAAIVIFHALRQMPGSLGTVPAGLVGRYEACDTWAHTDNRAALASCAAVFYRELASGAWLLPRERYLYYTVKARAWLQQAGADVSQVGPVERLEATKRTLTEAAMYVQATPCLAAGSPLEPRMTLPPRSLAVHTCAPADGAGVATALIVGAAWLDEHVWPPSHERPHDPDTTSP